MIFEMARFEIKSGYEAAFETGVAQAKPLFQQAKGCRGLELLRSVEQPSAYLLKVTWDNVDDHMVGFRNSDAFQEWRKLVGGFFASPPQVDHLDVVLTGF